MNAPDTAARLSLSLIGLAWWSAALLTLIATLLMGAIVLMRVGLILEERRARKLLATWRPLLMEGLLDGVVGALPEVHGKDWLLFMRLWNYVCGFVRGEARENLRAFGRRLGLEPESRRMLRSRSQRRRLMAVRTLGHLGCQAAWNELEALASQQGDPFLALTALQSLMMIDQARALPILVSKIAERTDWSPVIIANMLHDAGREHVGRYLAVAAREFPPAEAARLIRYLAALGRNDLGGLLGEILRTSEDEGLLSVCLQALYDPSQLDAVRALLAHPRGFVRVQAVNTLARLGGQGDRERLTAALADPEWWVRYRAAQGLASLPFVSPAELTTLSIEHPDRYARDMLLQVLAEKLGV